LAIGGWILNMSLNENDQNYGQLDLRDAIKFLLKRKIPIIAVSAGFALAAVLYVLALPKIYNVRTAIEIGGLPAQCGDLSRAAVFLPVEAPNQVKEKIINDMYGVPARKNFGVTDDFPVEAVNIYGTNIIYIDIKTADPDSGRKYLEAINLKVIEQHQSMFFDAESGNRDDMAVGRVAANGKRMPSGSTTTKIVKPPFNAGLSRPSALQYGILAGLSGLIVSVFAVSAIAWWWRP